MKGNPAPRNQRKALAAPKSPAQPNKIKKIKARQPQQIITKKGETTEVIPSRQTGWSPQTHAAWISIMVKILICYFLLWHI